MKNTEVLKDYEVRRGKDGKFGIYLRSFNVRLAVFNENSSTLQECLGTLFDEAAARKKASNRR